MNTVIYLIRHSVRLKNSLIEKNNSTQNEIIKSEKSILSPEGEKRAEILGNERELQNIDVVYVSNCVRTLQTAKYLMNKQNLTAIIDERFDERRTGKPIQMSQQEWVYNQYFNENFKTEGGESQYDVRQRFTEAFEEILDKHKGKRIAIFSHGYAITFFLMKWCKLLSVDENYVKKLSFRDEIIFNAKMNAPELFKLEIDENNELISIKNIIFDDLPFAEGSGK